VNVTPHTLASTDTPPRTEAGTRRALLVVGCLLVVAGVLGALQLVDPRPYSEASGEPAHLVHNVVWAACLIALSQLWPRLATWRSVDGRAIPAGILTLAAVGAALDACARFVSAFVNPYLAAHEPALLDTPPDAILLVPMLACGVVSMVGMVAVAVVGLRRRVLPRGAAVLLAVGALAVPVIGPISTVPVGAALVWIASARHRS
jgi:hypothetical protein